ncbi:MAG: single-stranded DNA-binding protein, partial [Patescibacteria group bacterium]
MNSLNKVQLIGNLTANPEVRETPNGQKVATIGVATTRVWKDAAGSKQEQTEFHNVVLWRGLAEVAEKYVTKGQKVYIEGYLQTRSWEDQTGAKRYRTEIVGDNLIMLSSKKDGASKTEDEFPQDD